MKPTLDAFLTEQVRQPAGPVMLAAPVAVDALPSPALIDDLEAMERNLERMAAHLDARGVGLRPHAKMHKCPEVARRQLERGAIGICAA
jgi:D-serine deaminase-like pyridoxal phosphate-dependent protein